MKIALTGHRPNRLQKQESYIEHWIKATLEEFNDIEEVYCGMAQGADQIFAEVAIGMNIPVICCYPYRRKKFHPNEQAIIDKAKEVRFICEKYTNSSVYWVRDKYMVDNCDVLLAVFDGKEVGGTWLTVDYARKIGKPVLYYDYWSM